MGEDPELAAIRARRMMELKASQMSTTAADEDQETKKKQLQQQEAARQSILYQILSPEARTRRTDNY
jgi:DNA-binding TFAR19-related protein (PDSD5 family)